MSNKGGSINPQILQSSSHLSPQTSNINDDLRNNISEKSKRKINSIIHEVQELSDIEKLSLYLKLPTGSTQESDPLKNKGPGNAFGKKADVEVAQTYTWITSHLEEDSTVSLPKCEVYEEYRAFCQDNKFEPLCVADFGKAMKHAFPNVKPRRLGQRGNSKYCYSGLKKRHIVEAPLLPDLCADDVNDPSNPVDEETCKSNVLDETRTVLNWAEKMLGRRYKTIKDLSLYLIRTDFNKSVETSGLISPMGAQQQNKAKAVKQTSVKFRRESQSSITQKGNQHKEPVHKKSGGQSSTLYSSASLSSLNSVSLNSIDIPFVNKPGTKRNRKVALAKSNELQSISVVSSPDEQMIIKTEQTEPIVDISKQCPALSMYKSIKGSQGKVNQGSLPAGSQIFYLSKLSQPTASGSEAGCSQPNSPVKATQSKYKRIQPKPVALNRSSSVAESIASSNNTSNSSVDSGLDHDLKRRHSVSMPFQFDNAVQKDILKSQSKRHIEDTDKGSSKKRMIDECVNTNIFNGNLEIESASSSDLSPISNSDFASLIKLDSDILSTGLPQGEQSGGQKLVIDDLEQDVLNEYFTHTNVPGNNFCENASDRQLSQLRTLLEKNLPQKVNKNAADEKLLSFSELKQTLAKPSKMEKALQLSSKLSNPQNENVGCIIKVGAANKKLEGKDKSVESMEINLSPEVVGGSHIEEGKQGIYPAYSNVQTQFPSVPQSPNTKRRERFSFQPISPRGTPTIPEIGPLPNNVLSSTNNSAHNQMQHVQSPMCAVIQNSVAVGSSLPASPFISPRNTPVSLSRSRNNSGQSSYSTSRQTPYQNFDSGVSSVSNSPFISPMPTPLPQNRMIRPSGRPIHQFPVNRTRHSSGPGNPYSLNPLQCASAMVNNRSSSLSPMILNPNDANYLYNQGKSIRMYRTFNYSNNGMLTPMSPQSEPLSPNYNLNMNSVMSIDPCQILHKKTLAVGNDRQRHMSSPYSITYSNVGASDLSETQVSDIQSLLKNTSEIAALFDKSLDRCHSVPVQQMKMRYLSGPTDSSSQNYNQGPEMESRIALISKSYPATPIGNGTSFSFPLSPPSSIKLPSSGSTEDLTNNFLHKGQDVMVSGLEPSGETSVTNEMNLIEGDGDLFNPLGSGLDGERRSALSGPPIEQDELQNAIDDLTSCDNDFSKFAQEIDLLGNVSLDLN